MGWRSQVRNMFRYPHFQAEDNVMNDIIEIAFAAHWTVRVRVQLGHGLPEHIRGPHEALTCMTNRWPAVNGNHTRLAKQQSREALRRRRDINAMRDQFVEACIEACMLAR